MPRKNLFRSKHIPYHVTGRTNHGNPFPVPAEKAWQIFSRECLAISMIYGAQIHAFTLMPNHFHMLLSTPEEDLGRVMNFFMGSTSRTINRESRRKGHLYGGPHYRTLIDSGLYYATVLKYIYRNPVRAGLAKGVQNYPYTTLAGLLGETHLPFPIYHPLCGHGSNFFNSTIDQHLEWMNQPFTTEGELAIRKGLKRRKFELPLEFSLAATVRT